MDMYNSNNYRNNNNNNTLISTIEVLDADDLKRSYQNSSDVVQTTKVPTYERRIHSSSSSPRIPHSAKKAEQQQQRRVVSIDVERKKKEIMSSLRNIEAKMDLVAHQMEQTKQDISNEYCYYYQLQQDKKKIQRKLNEASMYYGVGLVSGIGITSPIEKVLRVIERDIRTVEYKIQSYEDRIESLRIDLIYMKNEQKKRNNKKHLMI